MLTVLITRPLTTATLLAEKIKILGFNSVIFPAVEIKKLSNPVDLNVEMMIFISPTAVNCLEKIPDGPMLFAVGKDTALKLNMPCFYPDIAGSEGLLKLAELQQIKNKKILICQGKGGNDLIKETLSRRGARVTQAILYERVLPSPQKLPDLSPIDLIIVTSAESLNNLIKLLGKTVFEKNLLVSSERLKVMAKSLGFKSDIKLAKEATDEAILQALRTYF